VPGPPAATGLSVAWVCSALGTMARSTRVAKETDNSAGPFERTLAPFNENVLNASLTNFMESLRSGPQMRQVPGLDGDPLVNYAWIAFGCECTMIDGVCGEIGLKSISTRYSTRRIMSDEMHREACCCVVGLVQILRRSHHLFWEPDCLVDLCDAQACARDAYNLSSDAFLWLTAALDWVRSLTEDRFLYAPYLAFVWS
jgi:hypothetical protein